jgi:hypothetical protein
MENSMRIPPNISMLQFVPGGFQYAMNAAHEQQRQSYMNALTNAQRFVMKHVAGPPAAIVKPRRPVPSFMRTRSARQRAGCRKNKRFVIAPTFPSDMKKGA